MIILMNNGECRMRVTILGGAGGMGQWFAAFFRDNGAEVKIVDKSAKTEAMAEEIGVQFLNTDISGLPDESQTERIVDTDVLLLAVPIDLTGAVIKRVGPKMRDGSLLMDITSVKKVPVELMRRVTNECVEVLGSHPLYGPSAKSMRGQTVIFVPVRKGTLYERVYEMFERNGAKIEILTAEEHDEVVVVIMGLTHFVLIAFGVTLKELEFDVERSRKFMSPMYEIITDFVGRILHQDPRLYALMQTDFEMGAVHATFLACAKRLQELVAAGDLDAVMAEMSEAKTHFGDTERAMRESDGVIEEKIKLSLEKKV
ncbi:MAG: prephenate dehydrogenase/arogenate dehydrogenase family protein [Methanophagales archaeon]|nr:prephenate dehydrogenase/arogenate dehydrogenase family protein [Methanophagales archaeon]